MELFKQGLTNGVQIGVPHQITLINYSDELLKIRLNQLPDNFKLFVHVLGENGGFDLGQKNDELGVYRKFGRPNRITWGEWNERMLDFGIYIYGLIRGLYKDVCQDVSSVIHPGYGLSGNDAESLKKITSILKTEKTSLISLETVPVWDVSTNFFGYGGTPRSMKKILELLPGYKALLDYSHMWITHNQAIYFANDNQFNHPALVVCQDIEIMIEAFQALMPADICHFSGIAPKETLMDSHAYIRSDIPSPVLYALKQKKVICLEIDFYPDDPSRTISDFEKFRNRIE